MIVANYYNQWAVAEVLKIKLIVDQREIEIQIKTGKVYL